MSDLQRPSKQGGVTTYQAKVAAGYTKILASEMDADLDTIYNAWNLGVDADHIVPGSITGDLLAPGAVGTRELADLGVKTGDIADGAVKTAKLDDLSVTTGKLANGAVTAGKLDPAIGVPVGGVFSQSSIGVTPRMLLSAGATFCDVTGNAAGSPGYDNTKPGWLARINYATGDVFELWHTPAGATPAYTNVFLVTNTGDFTALGFARHKARAGGVTMAAPLGPMGSPGQAVIPLTVPWNDTANFYDAGVGGLHSPTFDCWGMITGAVQISTNGGLGFVVNLEQRQGGVGGWTTVGFFQDAAMGTIPLTVLRPIAANSQFRLNANNLTGGNVTINSAYMTLAVFGTT